MTAIDVSPVVGFICGAASTAIGFICGAASTAMLNRLLLKALKSMEGRKDTVNAAYSESVKAASK